MNMKKKTIIYLTFKLASQYLLSSRLSCSMLDFVLQNALIHLFQNIEKLFKNLPASKIYRRKMQSR